MGCCCSSSSSAAEDDARRQFHGSGAGPMLGQTGHTGEHGGYGSGSSGHRTGSGGGPSGAPVDREALARAAEERMKAANSRGKKGEVHLRQAHSDIPALPSDGRLKWTAS